MGLLVLSSKYQYFVLIFLCSVTCFTGYISEWKLAILHSLCGSRSQRKLMSLTQCHVLHSWVMEKKYINLHILLSTSFNNSFLNKLTQQCSVLRGRPLKIKIEHVLGVISKLSTLLWKMMRISCLEIKCLRNWNDIEILVGPVVESLYKTWKLLFWSIT